MNPIYQQYGKQMNMPVSDFMTRFQQFQKTIQGNPQQMVQQMLNSGKISQEQFNQVVQIANQMMRFIK